MRLKPTPFKFLVWFDSYQVKRSKSLTAKVKGQFWLILILINIAILVTLVTLLVHIGPSAYIKVFAEALSSLQQHVYAH